MIADEREQRNYQLREQYLGEKCRELREGFGVYVYENKYFRYEGEWKNGKKHGHGKLLMADGSYYEGQFEDGEIRGHGFRFWATSGCKYAGHFEDGELHGRGVMEYKDGSIYEGDWYRNVRQGRGKLTDKCSQVYEGEFHDHKRHGEGRQTYKNGHVYTGNWIANMRQGYGHLEQLDGTTYDGQWLHDAFSGEGQMLHCSGVIYEGMWLHGRPTHVPAILSIINGPTIQICQGMPFEVVVEVRTVEGEVLTVESGRELHVTAWFRAKPSVTSVEAGSTGPLLDLIEETEEKTRNTPFGYQVVPFPLTDVIPVRETSSLMVDYSTLSITEEEDGCDEVYAPAEGSPTPTAEDTIKEDAEKTEQTRYGVEITRFTTSEFGGTEEPVEREETSEITQEESHPLPPVPNVRSNDGCAIWETLLLPSAPALYRPYALLDEEAGIIFTSTKDGKTKTKDKRRLASKDREKTEEDVKAKYKRLGNPNFARPGEYVIIVEDVSEPPFFDLRLEPAFLKIDLQAPRLERRSISKKPDEKKKQWSTQEMISRSIARASVQLAESDVQRFRESRENI